jgi:hypothetical protein
MSMHTMFTFIKKLNYLGIWINNNVNYVLREKYGRKGKTFQSGFTNRKKPVTGKSATGLVHGV